MLERVKAKEEVILERKECEAEAKSRKPGMKLNDLNELNGC
jgi:hypothetical protein